MSHLEHKITLTFAINIINTYFNYIMTPKKTIVEYQKVIENIKFYSKITIVNYLVQMDKFRSNYCCSKLFLTPI